MPATLHVIVSAPAPIVRQMHSPDFVDPGDAALHNDRPTECPIIAVPEEVLQAARQARRVTLFTGAGMSAESGLPTFRDTQSGLWATYDPMTFASPQSWTDDPGLVWAWYQKRRHQLTAVEPNAGHHAVADWATAADVQVITQNVDDLHERAGTSDVVHIHGRLLESHCDRCKTGYHIAAQEPRTLRMAPPQCECGGLIRPSIVWFEEPMPHEEFSRAIGCAQTCDLLVIVGTSGVVYPAASLPQLARNRGASVIEINPDETELSDHADHTWRSTAAKALPALIASLYQPK
jgi:NAD-dependent deacetylase